MWCANLSRYPLVHICPLHMWSYREGFSLLRMSQWPLFHVLLYWNATPRGRDIASRPINFNRVRVGLVISLSHGRSYPKTIIKMVQTVHPLHCTHEFDSTARLSKRPCSVWNCLWGHALKESPRINRKSRLLYPIPVSI